jgi:nanoRNase/pAp phosphatase (c-di-AMP/oligoRNAs hydrolase)
VRSLKLALAAARTLGFPRAETKQWVGAAKTLLSFASSVEGDLLIITHANADPDAIAAAVLLASILERVGLDRISYAFPEGISKVSNRVLKGLNIEIRYFREPPRKAFRSIAVVDAANSVQLGAFRKIVERAGSLLLVDHHAPPGDLAQRSKYLVLSNEPAAVLVVYGAAKALRMHISGRLATLALTGVLFDSRRFIHVTPCALRAAAQLIENGADYQLALSLLEAEEDFSERVAKLKGAARCHTLRFGDYLVTITEIGSFEASVARALVSLGADAALVASEKPGECRLSIRLSRSFHLRTGLSAGRDLAAALAKSLSGEGGGHDLAGTFKGNCTTSEALRKLLQVLSDALGARARPL